MAAYFLLALLSIPICLPSVIVHRDARDSMYGLQKCMDSREIGSLNCLCHSSYATIMSKSGEKSSCQAPVMVGCEYSDFKSRQAYLISVGSFSVRISQGLTSKCRRIQRIFVWNLNPFNAEGRWFDVTSEVISYFAIRLYTASWDTYLTTNLDMKLWSGHVIKIKIGTDMCEHCLILKVKGNITYPADIDMFKSHFVETIVKMKSSIMPATTVNMATTKTTTPITYTSPNTTAIKYMTQINSVTALTPLYTDGRRINILSSSTMVALISGVLAIITVAVLSVVLFCRRRYSSNNKNNNKTENPLELIGENIGSSKKNNFVEYDDAIQLLAIKSPIDTHSTCHYEGTVFDVTKSNAIEGDQKDVNNYECIFDSTTGSNNHNNIKLVGQIRTENEKCSHEYAEIFVGNDEWFKGSNIDIKENILTPQGSNPYRYTEIPIGNLKSTTNIDIKMSLEKGKNPRKYTELHVGNHELINKSELDIKCHLTDKLLLQDEQINNPYDNLNIDKVKCIIRSVPVNKCVNKENHQIKQFSNPFYEERFVISPEGVLDMNRKMALNEQLEFPTYENNLVNPE